MSGGLILPPGAGNGGIEIFKPPWDRPTPEGTPMVLATLPKELVDVLVKRVADAVIERLEKPYDERIRDKIARDKAAFDGPRQDEDDGA